MIVVRGVTRNTKKIPKYFLFWVIFRFFRHFLVGTDHFLGQLPTPSVWKPIGVPLNTVFHRFTMVTVHFYRITTSNTLFWEYFELKSVIRNRVCKTSLSWYKKVVCSIFWRKRYIMVSCTRAYTVNPVMSPQNPKFDSFFQDFGLFLEIFRKKYNIFGQPRTGVG